jgi:NAD(P)-dependent dehydrogenase (short-subunit alcohol dehydrogenase family)
MPPRLSGRQLGLFDNPAGTPDDPARLIAWLATDEAGWWITGQVINSEGGFRRWDQ